MQALPLTGLGCSCSDWQHACLWVLRERLLPCLAALLLRELEVRSLHDELTTIRAILLHLSRHTPSRGQSHKHDNADDAIRGVRVDPCNHEDEHEAPARRAAADAADDPLGRVVKERAQAASAVVEDP